MLNANVFEEYWWSRSYILLVVLMIMDRQSTELVKCTYLNEIILFLWIITRVLSYYLHTVTSFTLSIIVIVYVPIYVPICCLIVYSNVHLLTSHICCFSIVLSLKCARQFVIGHVPLCFWCQSLQLYFCRRRRGVIKSFYCSCKFLTLVLEVGISLFCP